MTGLADEIACLFRAPDRPGKATVSILRDAAEAHLDLLRAALCTVEPRSCPALPLISSLLPQDPPAQLRFLCDPVLTEGIHNLAAFCPDLHAWHTCTADSRPVRISEQGDDDKGHCWRLGNAALPLLLRSAPDWCGELHLMTDHFGLLRFAMSDWCLTLTSTDAPQCIAVNEPLCLQLGRRTATWCLGTHPPQPFLQMPRQTLVQMVAYNEQSPGDDRLRSLDSGLRSQWSLGAPVCLSGVRFLPVHCRAQSRAAICGGIVKLLHDGLASASPDIHDEFCRYVKSILGFDHAGARSGTLQSFSEPMQPRLMGFNVPFSARNEPEMCPYCLTCLGHEMAHTKMYLLGSIGWRRGWRLLHNAGETTRVLPRYGRPLKVRTLFQIPYTHLYEWTLLMDASAAGLAEYDASSRDFVRFGDELRNEITEAFDAINVLAKPTPHGSTALEHFRRLFDDVDDRWRRLNRD